MPREHAEGGDQDALGLLLVDRPPTPALTQRPFADRALQPDDMPDAAAARTGRAAQGIERFVHAPAGVDLGVPEIGRLSTPERKCIGAPE